MRARGFRDYVGRWHASGARGSYPGLTFIGTKAWESPARAVTQHRFVAALKSAPPVIVSDTVTSPLSVRLPVPDSGSHVIRLGLPVRRQKRNNVFVGATPVQTTMLTYQNGIRWLSCS
jgi:hypothetical protein